MSWISAAKDAGLNEKVDRFLPMAGEKSMAAKNLAIEDHRCPPFAISESSPSASFRSDATSVRDDRSLSRRNREPAGVELLDPTGSDRLMEIFSERPISECRRLALV